MMGFNVNDTCGFLATAPALKARPLFVTLLRVVWNAAKGAFVVGYLV